MTREERLKVLLVRFTMALGQRARGNETVGNSHLQAIRRQLNPKRSHRWTDEAIENWEIFIDDVR